MLNLESSRIQSFAMNIHRTLDNEYTHIGWTPENHPLQELECQGDGAGYGMDGDGYGDGEGTGVDAYERGGDGMGAGTLYGDESGDGIGDNYGCDDDI